MPWRLRGGKAITSQLTKVEVGSPRTRTRDPVLELDPLHVNVSFPPLSSCKGGLAVSRLSMQSLLGTSTSQGCFPQINGGFGTIQNGEFTKRSFAFDAASPYG